MVLSPWAGGREQRRGHGAEQIDQRGHSRPQTGACRGSSGPGTPEHLPTRIQRSNSKSKVVFIDGDEGEELGCDADAGDAEADDDDGEAEASD